MAENYIPLYRKYRPQTLDTLVGQEHVKKTLTSAIELGKIAHAFLFTGPRGTGKTSTARILAKSLNCKNGPTIHPCGECESCRDITNSIPIDVIEIDAASNRKVEDTQSILEKIQYVPVNGKYKIYIIDEVHMLTNHAFNALLKTLEEPPENVVFILATTEVHKVLDTIKSRCQRFDFRRITTDDIVKHLRYISDTEKINITDDALFAIAKNSAGGMRDSISLLDQLSILGVSNQITVDDVNAILGRISFDVLFRLSSKIIESKHNEAIEVINEIYNSGNEPLQILTNLTEYFKNLLIVKNCGEKLLPELTGLNEPQIAEITKQKDLLETQQITFILEKISYYIKEIKMASNQHLWLEIGIIDLANMTENTKLIDLQNRIKALESGNVRVSSAPQMVVTKPAPLPTQQIQQTQEVVQKVVVQEQKQPPIDKPKTQEVSRTEEFTPPPMSAPKQTGGIDDLWQVLLTNIKSPATKALLNLATPVRIAPDGVIITFKNDNLVGQINNSNKKQMIIDAANTMFNKNDISVLVRTPRADDAQLASSASNTTASIQQPTQDEKKNFEPIIEKVKPSEKEIKVEHKELSKPKPTTTKFEITPEKEISEQEKKRLESDQERMILELFDGKFIEG